MNETTILILVIILILLIIEHIFSAYNNHRTIKNNKQVREIEKMHTEKHKAFMDAHENSKQEYHLKMIKLQTEVELLNKMLEKVETKDI